jgi:hypothetical protein
MVAIRGCGIDMEDIGDQVHAVMEGDTRSTSMTWIVGRISNHDDVLFRFILLTLSYFSTHVRPCTSIPLEGAGHASVTGQDEKPSCK